MTTRKHQVARRHREQHDLMPPTLSPRTIDLSLFDNSDFDRGAPRAVEAAWVLTRSAIFENGPFGLDGLRRKALLGFGAKFGSGGALRRGVRITFPWRLEVGDNCWLGEDTWLLNLAPILVGNNVCISQRAFLCTGNHDWSSRSLALITAPITVEDGAWIGASAFIGPGVTVGTQCVVTAGSVVTHDLPPNTICMGNPCRPVKDRKIRGE